MNIPKCSNISIPTKEDIDKYWQTKTLQQEEDLQRRVLLDFREQMKQMFMHNRSKFFIGVDQRKADFFVDLFQAQGYKPKLIRWNDRVNYNEYELVFYRKHIDPNYVEPSNQCCVIV